MTNHIFTDCKGHQLSIPLTNGKYQLPSNRLNYVMSIRASLINLLFELEKHNIYLTNLDIFTADQALRLVDEEAANRLSILSSFYLARSLIENGKGCFPDFGGNYPVWSHFGKKVNLPTLLLTVFGTQLPEATKP